MVHTAEDVAPTVPLYVPGAHDTQVVDPEPTVYHPGPQALHMPDGTNVPEEHWWLATPALSTQLPRMPTDISLRLSGMCPFSRKAVPVGAKYLLYMVKLPPDMR